jgi:hypothetical protein
MFYHLCGLLSITANGVQYGMKRIANDTLSNRDEVETKVSRSN